MMEGRMTPSVRPKIRIAEHGQPHREDAIFGRRGGVSRARPYGA